MTNSLYYNILAVFIIIGLIIPAMVWAGGYTKIVNNYPTTIIEGVSDDDLSNGLSMSLAAGGHQFDFATYDFQGSVVGAWYDEENAVSFGVAKRFEKMDILWHGNFTQNGGENGVVIGGTFRF